MVAAVVPWLAAGPYLGVPLPDLALQVGIVPLQEPHLVQVRGQAVVEVLHRRLLVVSEQDPIPAASASPGEAAGASSSADASTAESQGRTSPLGGSEAPTSRAASAQLLPQ